MSASSDLQDAVETRLATPGVLSVQVPIIKRRTRKVLADKGRTADLSDDLRAALGSHGLCLFVPPPLPTRAEQGVSEVFFSAAEVRVRISEQPSTNRTGKDAFDLWDEVACGLHWQLFGDILSHPLYLAPTPSDLAEDARYRVLDVIFIAVYGLLPTA